MSDRFLVTSEFAKVNEDLGIIFGYGIVCKIDGEDYFDFQGDHIPEESMLKAVTDFMKNSRVAKEMHEGDQVGTTLFSFPMTDEIAKSLGIIVEKTGWLVGIKPDNPEILEKFRDGTFTGFSIGGRYIENVAVED